MKIFGWMQSKLKYGKNNDESSKKPNSKPFYQTPMQESGKEEVNDWLHGLLAIGTFGKNDLKEDLERINLHGNITSSSFEDQQRDSTSEEAGNLLQDEYLNSLLMHKQDDHDQPASAAELEQASSLERFLSRQSTLEPERIASNITAHSSESNTKKCSLQRSTSLVLSRGKDASVDNTENAIGKQSLSFLLKKIFVCRSGFPSPPTPKAPITEPRMEKILRAILHKKICPQSSSPSLSMKKYLESRHRNNSNEDDITEKADNGSKWVKTDSEYIVLEI